MNIVKLNAVVVAGALSFGGLSLVGAQPASAASVATNVFLTNLIPNVDFLDRSSRTALDNSKSPKLRDFAHTQAKDQTMAANAVDDWVQADKGLTVAATEPASDQVVTGRSVAIDGQATQAIDNRLALGQEDIDFLEGLNGHDFDVAYKAKQLDALNQVETDYRTYLAQGDDPVLLAIAKRELPKVEQRIVDLRKL